MKKGFYAILITSIILLAFSIVGCNIGVSSVADDIIEGISRSSSGTTYYVLQAYDGKYAKLNSSGKLATTESDISTALQFEKIASGSGYVWKIKDSDSYLSVSSKRIVEGSTASVYVESDASDGWIYIKSGSYYLKDMGDEVGVNSSGGQTYNYYKLVEVSSSGTSGDSSDTSSGDTSDSVYPYDVLGLQNWKLNCFTGSVSDPDYQDYYTTKSPYLQTFSSSYWFWTDGTWVYFRPYAGYPTTSSKTGNPRVELREMTSDGSDEISWDLTSSSEVHTMEWIAKITRLPSSGKLCFGQIHSTYDSYDDIIRIQVRGDADQTSGTVTMYVMGYVVDDNADDIGSYTLGDEIHLKLVATNKTVTLYKVSSSGSLTKLKSYSGIGSTGNYFKAGNYLQSMKGKSYSSDDYGVVGIRYLKVTHD
ncbi:polysaccharide lyase family 7 protein [Spirochaetia bacterium 38H-sp]|uniref:Polysaccharide lyase family 7 protein n=1 Tax=Rarispira pelagica TaxID=3141764 RepID=A0ABU9UCR1_9SPIR